MLQTSSSSSDRPVGSRDSDGSSGSLAVCGVGYLDNAAVCNISDIVTVPSTREGPLGTVKAHCAYTEQVQHPVCGVQEHLDGVVHVSVAAPALVRSQTPDRPVGSEGRVVQAASLPLLLLYALLCCALQGAGWPLARGAQSGSMTGWTPHFKGPAGRWPAVGRTRSPRVSSSHRSG